MDEHKRLTPEDFEVQEKLRERREHLARAVSKVETEINFTLLVCDDEKVRRVLLTARGDLREAMGEART